MIDETEVRMLIADGRLGDAERLVAAFLERDPDHAPALKLAAEIAFRRGDREAGYSAAMKAVRRRPSDVEYGLDCAFNLVRSGRRDDALAIADLVSGQKPRIADHLDVLGTIYTHCERPEAALPHFEQACRQVPGSARFRFNLASVQRMLGATGDAETNLDAAIALDGTQGSYFLARSQLRLQKPERNHIPELRTALDRMGRSDGRISVGYALAKELEDITEHAESFRFLAAASAQERARIAYDPAQDIAMMRSLRSLDYARPGDAAQAKPAGPGPIFVLGLPRSGTTLVERIIASSGQAASAGETNTLAAELWRVAARSGRPADPTNAVVQAIESSGRHIGRAYLEILGARFPGQRYIDKTPGNYLFAGLIGAHVPGARIISVRRGAMDSCYAMYKTLFADVYPFSYDLRELADYFVEWTRLMGHWQATLGEALLTIAYEDLIRSPEATMRKIIDHCGLEWRDKCLKFHELSSPVTSASAGQVNAPLNDRSVGLWQRYHSELLPLAERLAKSGIDLEV